MLIRRDFDLNSVDMYTESPLVYTESLVEVFRETMLNQEIIFQKQVHELHRLYRTQKTLMQKNSWMEFDRYNLSEVGLKHSQRQEFLEGCQDVLHKLQQRPPGYELPAKHYTGHVDPEDLKLSLRIGEDNWRKQSGKKTWFDVNRQPFSQIVIDLEESSATTSNEDSGNAPPFSSASPTVNSGSKYESQKSVVTDPIIPSSLRKDYSNVTVENTSSIDDHERSSFDQDLKRCNGNVLNEKLSTKFQRISSYRKLEVDLNKVFCDDSSCYSNDPIVTHPSTACSSHASLGLVGRVDENSFRSKVWTQEYNCSDETSGIIHLEDAGNFALVNSNSNHGRARICAEHPKFNELSGSEGVRGPCEEFGSNKNDSNDATIDYRLEISKSQTHTCLATRALHHEKGESEEVFSYSDHSKNMIQDGHGNTSLASCKPCHIGDNESSNAETMQSEVELGNPLSIDRLSGNQKGSQAPTAISGEQNLGSSDSSEFKAEYLSKEESDEDDVSIQKAAESLIHISLESSAYYQDCSTKDLGSTEMEANERAMPESSYDSFELITLKLKDCSEDDLCVSSKPTEVNFTEKKDYGFKIRRGRRLKDFQRDILPGLASLSRQEIREDINILEGVLRSREYRKIQAKMADGHSWCTPARSRRSRLNYIARRRFS